ncbi:unnamed protein product [Brassica oleracea var. botrytis]|uniref:(rape) hypothetical protein n=1 Tax=Brassica napus TaxID=3708 RepID=A0A816RHX7_BRANA|nr:unnamed protein product [Brassica napus]
MVINFFSRSQAFRAFVCGFLGIKDMCFPSMVYPPPFSIVSTTIIRRLCHRTVSPPTFSSISATILTWIL